MAKRGRKALSKEVKKDQLIGFVVDKALMSKITNHMEKDGNKHSRSVYLRGLIETAIDLLAIPAIPVLNGFDALDDMDDMGGTTSVEAMLDDIINSESLMEY